MDVYALDSDFNLVMAGIPYDNLQWSRRYYEAGDFEMQIPLSAYDKSWAYIGSPQRGELGMVQRVYSSDNDPDKVLIGGFFAEKMLDEKVCYPPVYRGRAEHRGGGAGYLRAVQGGHPRFSGNR